MGNRLNGPEKHRVYPEVCGTFERIPPAAGVNFPTGIDGWGVTVEISSCHVE